MKYCFTTLAVNEPYETKTKEFYSELRKNTKNCNFFITTTNDELLNQGERIYTNIINPPSLNNSGGGFSFNLNLKCLSLKHVLNWEKENEKHDYVIFTDGDWGMYSGFTEEKILNLLSNMEKENIDCVIERPALIADSKKNPETSFFRDKLYDYDVFEHNKWDNAHCVNEQILVIKNNAKFKFFVQRWEQFLWYSIANDIRNYPDGFEIGISILESEMTYNFGSLLNYHLTDCFYFYTKSEQLHIRF
jgi:hypothetical protein